MMEAFDSQNDSDDIKIPKEQLVNEIENFVYEMTGKNSKDKSYREKAKKILTRLKGNRNGMVRGLLKSGTISTSDFCKLSDKQLDEDSYFEKYIKPGDSSVPSDKKQKGQSIKPPNFKNLPIHSIDLSSNATDVNEYFNNIKASEEDTNNNAGEPNKRDNEEEKNLSEVNNYSNMENNNMTDDNMSNRVHTEIETNSVRTDTFSVREDNKEVPAEPGRISPRMNVNNGRSVQFNPPSRNVNQSRNNVNQTYDVGSNRAKLATQKENLNSTLNEAKSSQTGKTEKSQSRNENLERLKELMEKKKMGKVI